MLDVRCSKFTNNKNNIKIKRAIDRKINLYSHCVYCGLHCMIWLMEILKVYLEEQLWIRYYILKHLILQKELNMIEIKDLLLQ